MTTSPRASRRRRPNNSGTGSGRVVKTPAADAAEAPATETPEPVTDAVAPESSDTDEYARLEVHTERARAGNLEKEKAKLESQNKLFVRDRLALLLDEDSFVEDGLLANALASGLPADGVVTGVGRIDGRPVCVMANDSTVKAGSWGARTVEKIVRITEYALHHEMPVVYLVDSAGARITDQVELFPGRRGAGRIFANEVRLSGKVPQICCLFGPSAAGGAYIPAFCDAVFMVEANASMYLGSPRMAEVVIGEKVSLQEMGGARMHATISGCGDNLYTTEEDAIRAARRYLSYLPTSWRGQPPAVDAAAPVVTAKPIRTTVPTAERRVYDMHKVIDALVDEGSFFELKPLWAKELIIGFARLDGKVVGVVANNPLQLGGVLFVDSADKAARFIWLCDAFNVPLVFLADVPGFMIGSQVEKAGIIRHGAKMITAVAQATVPEILGDRAQGVRRRSLRDVRTGVRSRRVPRAADRADRGDGPRAGRERGVLQPDSRHRRSRRAGRVRGRPASGVHRGCRSRAPRGGAHCRRGRAARGPTYGVDPAPCVGVESRPRRRGKAPRRAARLSR